VRVVRRKGEEDIDLMVKTAACGTNGSGGKRPRRRRFKQVRASFGEAARRMASTEAENTSLRFVGDVAMHGWSCKPETKNMLCCFALHFGESGNWKLGFSLGPTNGPRPL
jgi:hypothetical protein